ncbi:FlgD immunoglobulin-like domain containing protein, partial [Melioribacteraceae bacterium 4301-Me]|uniref:FlgD immunoglobulin-like domain containing protein n=1 Tax=Pyranulibacter aquaticus TaxID=3163344 RepID=UPI003597464E
EGSKSLSVRLHPLGKFKGTVYCDLLQVQKLDITGIKSNEIIPVQYTLFQNYPNPFNPTTIISYTLPKQSIVSLKIYDILGREVRTLVNTEQTAGTHKIEWDGKNNYGSRVASGTYIYRIEAGDFIQSKKMILLK